ncbi:unnamed protein product [Lampetra planeri]
MPAGPACVWHRARARDVGQPLHLEADSSPSVGDSEHGPVTWMMMMPMMKMAVPLPMASGKAAAFAQRVP